MKITRSGELTKNNRIENKNLNISNEEILIDQDKCKKCGICMQYCPDNAIYYDEKEDKIKINKEICKNCKICINQCPFKAIISKKNIKE